MQPTNALLAIMAFAGAANAAVSLVPASYGFQALETQRYTNELSINVTFLVHDCWQH